MSDLIERYADCIAGRLDCLDRVVITGTLPGICHAQGMTNFLYSQDIRIFDYARFAEPLRDQIRENAERLAQVQGVEIEFIRKKNVDKEEVVQAVLERRGRHPGLVHIIACMETCPSYKPWHDKSTGRTFLKPDSGKCLHYYFYFIDEHLGLCYVRVPTWCPFRLQVYFNGHNWLAGQMSRKGIGYRMMDNAFLDIDDWDRAQELADAFDVKKLHRLLDRYASQCCPVTKRFRQRYHWSVMQAEYASDIVFRTAQDLQPLYEILTRTAIHAVKPDHVATFLGRRLSGLYEGELGNHYHTRIEGTRIKHHMGDQAAIKMYDKFARILRVETTVNDVSFFKHYRKVEHRDGTATMKQAPLRKNIYSLPRLVGFCRAANNRYLAFISDLDDPSPAVRDLRKIAAPRRDHDRSFRGFNLFHEDDHRLFLAIARGEFTINGMSNKALRRVLPHKTPAQMSRLLKNLRVHGLLKKIGRTYKYYLTKLGRKVIAAALELRELIVIPTLAGPLHA